MVRRWTALPVRLALMALVAALMFAGSAAAQTTDMIRGKVVDDKGQPLEGVKITVESLDVANRKTETKTNKSGEYVQIGLFAGNYKVRAEKEKYGTQEQDSRVRPATQNQLNFQLTFGAAAMMSKEEAQKALQLRKIFEDGVGFSKAGQYDQAIEAFQKGNELRADCADCYYNIGYAYTQKKDYEKAEAAYKKAVEIKPDFADAHNGLATIYNAMKRFDEAAAEGTKAAQAMSSAPGGAGADALYNQGVILWNAGKSAEAKKQFEAAVAANPNHAESHYQLGMALISEGNMAGAVEQFETYVKLAPEGPNAAQAKGAIAALKK